MILIDSWDDKVIRVHLLNVLAMTYRQGSIISNFFVEESETKLLADSIKNSFTEQSKANAFKTFYIKDIDAFIFLEVVAASKGCCITPK